MRNKFWQGLMNGVVDFAHPEIRQMCCFTLGTLAYSVGTFYLSNKCGVSTLTQQERLERHQLAQNYWQQPLIEAAHNLLTSLNSEDAEAPVQTSANDNAVSAVGKILHYVGHVGTLSGQPLAESELLLQQWLRFLPITADTEEATHTFGNFQRNKFSNSLGFLLELLSQSQPLLMSQLGQVCVILLEAVTSILSAAQHDPSLKPWDAYGDARDVYLRACDAIRVILTTQLSEQDQKTLWQILNEEQKQAAVAIIEGYTK